MADWDLRLAGKGHEVSLPPDRAREVAEFKKMLPGSSVDFDLITKSPKWVGSSTQFLTGPQAELAAKDADGPIRRFLQDHRALFGHGPELLDRARRVTDYSTARGPSRKVVWHQQMDGIDVFEAILQANLTTNSALINIGSQMVPDPEKILDEATRAALTAHPPVAVEVAVAVAGRNVGEKVSADTVKPMGLPSAKPDKRQQFRATMLTDAEAGLVWVPMDEKTLRLAWDVTMTSRSRAEMYRVLVDAQTSEVLVRHALTAYISPATYRVYTQESPTPRSPGHESPSSLQPASISRQDVTLSALDTNASPNGWINDGENITSGNNTDTYTDTDDSNTPDLPRTTGNPSRVFNFPLDLSQPPASFKDAANTQLFYLTNRIHDRLYQLGFTEAAGNFQVDNFGRGGQASDPVNAEAQDGSGIDNANFSTPVDGGRGRMQMYLWTSPTPDRDGCFDAELVGHEYGHGVSNRLVGGPSVTITSLTARGMGEGWSDFYGLSLTAEADDNPHGNWAMCAWPRYLYGGWYSENYYYGLRRHSYSTDMLKNPHTLRDIDPSKIDLHPSIPRNPTFSASQDATQNHHQGTVWCAALWDLRANLIVQHGFAIGNERALFLVTEGMKYAPANPNFIQARDGILQAAMVNHPENTGELWTAFAKRGMGHGATAPASTTSTGIVESYKVPDSLEISDRSGWNIRGNWNSTFSPTSKTLILTNDGSSSLNWQTNPGAAWISVSPPSGTLAPGANAAVTVSSQVGLTTAGFHSTNLVFANTTSGFNQPIGIRLYVTPPVARRFDLSSNPGWSTTGEWALGTPTGGGGLAAGGAGNADPTTGATGAQVYGTNLLGNVSSSTGGPYYLTTTPVDLTAHRRTRLRFMRWLNGNALANARLTVQVSTDGTNWREVFVNPGTETTDNAWTLMDYDISSIADLQPTVRVRWGYQNISSAGSFSGWNIDDVEFLGEPIAALNLVFGSSVSESTSFQVASVQLNTPQIAPLVVSLQSSQPDVATVPATITIPAGSLSESFLITPVNDTLLDGSQTTLITASASNMSTESRQLTVHDDETATLTLSLPATVIEGTGNATGSISVSAPPARDVAVTLSSNHAALGVPATVTIPAGSVGPVTFTLQAPDNVYAGGAKLVAVTASVTNWTSNVKNVQVTDDEVPTILITGPSSAREGDGPQVYTITVNTLHTNAVTVELTSNDPSELTVPLTAVLIPGQSSTTFQATVINDAEKDGAQTATLTASHPSYLSGSRPVGVADNDAAYYTFATIPSPQKRNKAFLAAVSARDIQGALITNHSGGITLTASSSAGTLPVFPATATLFVNGVAAEQVTLTSVATAVSLKAQDGQNNSGTSNAFDVGAVSHDSFLWSGLPSSTISANTLFSGTVKAVDDEDVLASSYQDPTRLEMWLPTLERTVGTGTGSTSSVYNTAAQDSRAQMIITSQELGGTARWIGGISFTLVTSAGNTMSNVNLRMKHTDRADFVNGGWESGGWQTVYSNTSFPGSSSILLFDQPFFYDGTRNVMLDFSFNGSTSSTAGQIRQTPRTARLLYGSSQSTYGDPLLWSGLSGPAFTIGDEVPNMGFYEARNLGALANSPVQPSSGLWSGQVYVPGTIAATSFWLRALAPSGAMGFSGRLLLNSTVTSPTGSNAVFNDGFESSTLGVAWSTAGSSGTTPRTMVISSNAPKTGAYHMQMDNSNNVSGVYARNSPTLTLDLAGRRNVSFEWYAKSLGDESHPPTLTGPLGSFDSAMNYDGVAISRDGTEWVEITALRGLSSSYGVSATRVVLDPVIQRLGWSYNNSFRLRFSQYDDLSAGSSDGIAIDDVYVRADPVSRISLSLPPTLAEGALDLPFTLTLPFPYATDVTVNLTCTPATRLSTPAVVVIPAGQTIAQSAISAPQNFFTEGGFAALITAQATGYSTSYTHVRITDDEQFTLGLVLPASITEGTTANTATITISPPPPAPTNVFLSTASTQATVVSHALVNAGAVSTTFTMDAVDDIWVDGTQPASITVSAPGMTTATASLDVLDNEPTTLTLTLPASLAEGGPAGVGVVAISGLSTSDTTVLLSSADVSEATVPASAVIPAGQTSVNFLITPVDDSLQDGTQNPLITAGATGFAEGAATVSVRDNDPSSLAFSVIPSPQKRHSAFPLTITARDGGNETLTDFNGMPILQATGAGTVSTSKTLTFTEGVWSGQAWLDGTGTGVILSASGFSGSSNAFDVVMGGAATALAFSPLPPGVRAGSLLPLHISAVDSDGVLVSETTGPVTLELRTFPGNAVIFSTSATLVNGRASLTHFTIPSTVASVYVHATAGSLTGQTAVFSVTPAVALDNPPATGTEAVFQDGFETGTRPEWTITGTGTHRTVITTANTPRTGSNHLVMDSSASSSYARNEATLTLDLTGRTGVELNFWMKEFTDEDHSPPTSPFLGSADFDGVAISADGTTWYEVQGLRSANGISSAYTQFTVNLSAAALTRGLNFNSTFKIRFNHYDDFPVTSDGFAFDDVVVRADRQIAAEPVVTVFDEDFEAGTFRPEWQVTGTGMHRTVISTAESPRGNLHLLMDAHTAAPARNEATLSLDLSGLQDLNLKFWMKDLGDEDHGPPSAPFSQGADFDGVAISADGLSWHEVHGLRTANSISSSYQQFAVDLSAAAASRGLVFGPGFKIRFNHYDNEPLPADGFAFDDIVLTARPVAKLALAAPASLTEGSSVNASVTLPAPRGQDSLVRLTSNRPGRVSMPATLTVPAGELSAGFSITLSEDSLLLGDQSVQLMAETEGLRSGFASVVLMDNETVPGLDLSLSGTSLAEGSAGLNGTVSYSGGALLDLGVVLSASPANGLTFPSSVTLLAGTSSAAFTLAKPENHLLLEPLSTVFKAEAGPASDSIAVDLTDNDAAIPLTITLPSTAWESDAPITGTVGFTMPKAPGVDLVVTLNSTDSGSLNVPASVIIPAGSSSVTFLATPQGNNLFDGTRSVILTASANGVTGDTHLIAVRDDDLHHIAISAIASPQVMTLPLSVTLRAVTIDDTTLSGIQSSLSLSAASGSNPVAVTYGAVPPAFVNGVWTGQIAFQDAATNVILTAGTAGGITGTSNPFEVSSGPRLAVPADLAMKIPQGEAATNLLVTLTNTGVIPATWSAQVLSNTWLTVNPASGTVPTGGSSVLTATFNPSGWLVGSKLTTTLRIQSNDPTAPQRDVPVTLNIMPAVFQFATSAIPAAQRANVSFPVTLTAQDVSGGTATSFNGSAALSIGPDSVTVTGTGTGTTGYPFYGPYYENRTQSIYYPSEVGPAGRLRTLEIQTQTAPGSLSNFSVRVKPTARTSYSATDWETSGWTTLYQGTLTVGATGWVNLPVNAIFDYDGVSNLMVDFSFDNVSSVTAGVVLYTGTSQLRTLFQGAFGGSGNPLLWQGATPAASIASWVPNLRFSKFPNVPVMPQTVTFTDGIWSGNVTLQANGTSVILRSQHTVYPAVTGQSNSFNITSDGPVSITAAASGVEGGVIDGTVSIGSVPTTDLTVNLTSSDTSEATVPASVVIPAGQTSAPFTMSLVDDTLLDGVQTAQISANAPHFSIGTHTLSVTDNDVTTVSVLTPASITENSTGTATVQLGTPTAANLTILLASNLTSRLTVPASVVIPAGQSSVNFTLTAPNTNIIDGTQTATITATLAGSTPGTTTIDILDNESRLITVYLTFPSLSEGEGPRTNAGYVSLSGNVAAPLTINLSSSDTTEVTIPSSVTIATGSSLAYFTLTPVNDALYDGSQTSMINASAATYITNATGITITDDDVHHFGIVNVTSQVRNKPFNVTVYAQDINNAGITSYTGNPVLSAAQAGVPISMTPASTGSFVGDNRSVMVTIPTFASAAVITAMDTSINATGSSNSFVVGSGPAASFAWAPVSSPKVAEAPFSATITALDDQGNTATSYTGTVALSVATMAAVGSESASLSTVVNTYYPRTRHQMIFTAAELRGAQTFNSLGINVLLTPESMNAFTIRLKHTSKSDYTGTGNASWESTGWTTCYTASPKSISSGGWHVMNFSTPFDYNGTDNLMVDISYANSVAGAFPGGHTLESSSNARCLYHFGDTTTGNPLTWSGTTPTPTTRNYRPNVRLGFGQTPVPSISPTVSSAFTAGIWTGNLTVGSQSTKLALDASSGLVTGRSPSFSVSPPPLKLTLTLPSSASESGGSVSGTLAVNSGQPSPLVVNLSSSNTGEATVPATITVPAGTLSVPVTVTLVNDSLKDGAQIVTITAENPGAPNATANLTVFDDELNHFQFSALGTKVRNAPFSVSISARAIDGQILTSYNGSVVLSAKEGATSLPISSPANPLTGFASGSKTFDVTLGSFATAAVLTVTDGAATGSSNSFAVGSGSHTRFVWSTITSPQVAKEPFQVTLTATDDYGNTTPTFIGTAALSVTTTPGPSMQPATTGSFSGGTWTGSITLGSQSLTPMSLRAISGLALGISNTFTVLPSPPQITLTLPASVSESAGTVNATLSFDNAHPTAYVINLNSSDTTAVQAPATVTMPAYTLSVPVTLTVIGDSLKDGAQDASITATIPGIHTTSSSISVLDDEMHDFNLALIPSPQTKNDLFSVIVTARSIDGLTVTNYAGSPTLTAADGGTPLPLAPSSLLTGFTNGQKTLNVSIGSPAAQAVLTVTDGMASGSSNPFEVLASGTPSKLVWDRIPALQFINEDIPVTLKVQDGLGNVTPGFNGQVSLSAETPRSIGIANNVNEHPAHSTYTRARSQQIFLAAEVGEAGIIESLTLNIADAGSTATLTDFVIRMKHTSQVGYSAIAGQAVWETAGFTTVYQGSPQISGSGRITFRFSNGFIYDGTSNLIIDYSHRDSSTVGGIGPRFTSTSNVALRSLQFGTHSAVNGDPLIWSGTAPAGQTEYRTTDVWLGFLSDAVVTPSTVTMTNGAWTGNLRLDKAAFIQSINATAATDLNGISGNFTVLGFRHALNPEPAFTGGLTNSLQWSSPAPGVQYQVQRSTTPDFTSPVSSAFNTTTQSLQTNLVNGQIYYYRLRMRAIGSLSWLSDWSPAISSTQDATPPTVQANDLVTLAPTGFVTGTAADTSGIQGVSIGAAQATSADGFAHWSGIATNLLTGDNLVTVTAHDNAVPPNTAAITARVLRTGSDEPRAPSVYKNPDSIWAAVGEEGRFSPVIVGSRPMYFEWLKDGKQIRKGGAEFIIPSVKPVDAGTYKLYVSSGQSSVASTSDLHLATYTALPDRLTVKNGGSFKLTTTVTLPKGATVNYFWSQVGVSTDDGTRGSGAVIAGRRTKSISVSRMTSLEAGNWHLRMELVIGSVVAAILEKDIQVRVLTQVPVLAAVPTPMEVWVSQPVSLSLSATESPTSYAATGLPPGLLLDKVTGLVSGRVTTASKIDTKTGLPIPAVVKFTATNVVGTSTAVELRLVIKDHFGSLAGTFQGLVQRSPVTNFNHGGLTELTLAKTGVATGSFTLSGQKYSFVSPAQPAHSLQGDAYAEMAFNLPRTKPENLGDLSVALSAAPTQVSGWMDDLQFAPPGNVHLHGSVNNPQGFTIDEEGVAALADAGNARIRTFTPGGGDTPHHASPYTSSTISSPRALLPIPGAGYYVVGDSSVRILYLDGVVETFAGMPGQSGHQEGKGTLARFRDPSGICVDTAGNLYLTDAGSHVVRKITPLGVVTTLAGKPDTPGHMDGTGSKALFNTPSGISYDPVSKTLLVVDTENSVIRRVTLTGAVTTWIGSPGAAGVAPGIGTRARLSLPRGITTDGRGTFYITDGGIWQISPAGIAERLSAAASADLADQPAGLVFDPVRRILLVSYPEGHRVEQISLPPLSIARQESQFTLARTPLTANIPTGLFNASLTPASVSGPQGTGHASLNVSTKAAVTFSARLPDGQTWTASSPLTHDRRFSTSTMLNKGLGSVQGTFVLDNDGDLSGSTPLTWLKLPNFLNPPDPIFPGGFSVPLTIAGGRYTPGNLNTFFGLPKGPVTFDFTTSGGGITALTQPFTLTAPGTVKVTTPNPNTLSLSISPATGLVTGKFQFGSPARSASFSGLILHDGSKRGVGHFLMPASTLKNATIESGQFTLSPR
ncbi:MAG: M36 family metallopeptidase [Verrucomicrobiota bacterium]